MTMLPVYLVVEGTWFLKEVVAVVVLTLEKLRVPDVVDVGCRRKGCLLELMVMSPAIFSPRRWFFKATLTSDFASEF